MAIIIDDDELVALWHKKEEPAGQIAKRLGMRVGQLVGQWRRLKTAGKLPAVARNPSDSHYDRPVDQNTDGRIRVSDEDPLLRALEAKGHEYAEEARKCGDCGAELTPEDISSGATLCRACWSFATGQ